MEKSKEKFMVSRWVPKFPGFQVHKWTKQRFHESREKMAEYLTSILSLMNGNLWVQSVRETIIKCV